MHIGEAQMFKQRKNYGNTFSKYFCKYGYLLLDNIFYACDCLTFKLFFSRKELVDPSGLSEEQLREIPYTKIE